MFLEVRTETFLDRLKVALLAASTDETRKHLNGVLLSLTKDGVSIAATDGHCMFVVELRDVLQRGGTGSVLISVEDATRIVRLATKPTKQLPLRLELTGDQVHVSIPKAGLSAQFRAVDAVFPPVHAVLPTELNEEDDPPLIDASLHARVAKAFALLSDQRATGLRFIATSVMPKDAPVVVVSESVPELFVLAMPVRFDALPEPNLDRIRALVADTRARDTLKREDVGEAAE